jgi:flagellar hook-basal body complex protein FliE
VSWQLTYTKQAQKDASKLATSGLKAKAQELLTVIKETAQARMALQTGDDTQ